MSIVARAAPRRYSARVDGIIIKRAHKYSAVENAARSAAQTSRANVTIHYLGVLLADVRPGQARPEVYLTDAGCMHA